MKKAFTLIEIIAVFLLILMVTALVVPLVINDSKKAQEISKWRHTYSDILYVFQSLNANNNAQLEKHITERIEKVKTSKEKEDVIINEFSPYLRIKSQFEDKDYKIKYLNSEKVLEKQFYYFDNFYLTQNDTIVGIKWIGELYDEASLILLMFDVNGPLPPNTWGKDVFGINIYRNRIEPFGQNIPEEEITADCSKNGRGVYCSYDYLMGAQF